MENWGAITFRENLLLHYPETTSKAGEERICEVIAHEIAHQWFGNLVTPSDWRYLWLNESFATYFGYGMVDHYHPEWEIVAASLFSARPDTALRRDALQETFPIEIPGGDTWCINTSTAPIIYSKGGSILRQIRGFIGDAAFREGLRHYLSRHAYQCAGSLQFWEAFEAVSDQPVSDIMRAWVEQPGYPAVRVRRDGTRLTLTQERFSYLPARATTVWPIPITIRLFDPEGGERQISLLMRRATEEIDIDGASAFKINDGQTGFYRVFYEKEDLADLGRRVRDKTLSPEDRWGLQNDLFARVQAGEASLADYLSFLGWYENEDAYLPLVSLDSHLRYTHLVARSSHAAIAAQAGRKLTERVLNAIGWEPAAGEPHVTAALRDQLFWHAVLYGSETARHFADRAFRDLMAGEAVHPDILKAVLQAGALLLNDRALTWMTRRLDQTASEHERLAIMAALGCFRDSRTLAAARDYVLDHVPDRNRFMPLVAMAANPFAMKALWAWFVDTQERFKDFHPLLFERVIAAIVPVAGLADPPGVIGFMERTMEASPQTRDVARLSLEKLEINRRFREAQ